MSDVAKHGTKAIGNNRISNDVFILTYFLTHIESDKTLLTWLRNITDNPQLCFSFATPKHTILSQIIIIFMNLDLS